MVATGLIVGSFGAFKHNQLCMLFVKKVYTHYWLSHLKAVDSGKHLIVVLRVDKGMAQNTQSHHLCIFFLLTQGKIGMVSSTFLCVITPCFFHFFGISGHPYSSSSPIESSYGFPPLITRVVST